MLELSRQVDAFAGADYKALSQTKRQFPDVGGRDQYYGGTAYTNEGGLGVQIRSAADNGDIEPYELAELEELPGDGDLVIMPITRLYNRQRNFRPSLLIEPRIPEPFAIINPADVAQFGLISGDRIELRAGDTVLKLRAEISEEIAPGLVAAPRHLSDEALPLSPTRGSIMPLATAELARA